MNNKFPIHYEEHTRQVVENVIYSEILCEIEVPEFTSNIKMDNKIYVFEGYTRETKDGFMKQFKKRFKKLACYTEYDFTNVSSEDRARFGGEGKIILNTFARFVVSTIANAKSCGGKVPIVIEDFLPKIDEAVEIYEYIKPLFDVSVMIIYFAEDKNSVKRLRESGLTVKSI